MLIKKALRNLLFLMDEQTFTIKTAAGTLQCGPNGCRPMATPPPSTAGTPEVQARNREAYQARENDRLARLAQARKEWQERNPASMVPDAFDVPTSTGAPSGVRAIKIDPRYGGGYGVAGAVSPNYTVGQKRPGFASNQSIPIEMQRQIVQKYPQIGVANSAANQAFIAALKQQSDNLGGKPVAVNPMTIADRITKQQENVKLTPNHIVNNGNTSSWMPNVVQQYPQIGVTGSPMNKAYMAAVRFQGLKPFNPIELAQKVQGAASGKFSGQNNPAAPAAPPGATATPPAAPAAAPVATKSTRPVRGGRVSGFTPKPLTQAQLDGYNYGRGFIRPTSPVPAAPVQGSL